VLLGLKKKDDEDKKDTGNLSEVELQLAVAVYLACYFDANKSSKQYYNSHKNDENFNRFFLEDYCK